MYVLKLEFLKGSRKKSLLYEPLTTSVFITGSNEHKIFLRKEIAKITCLRHLKITLRHIESQFRDAHIDVS